MDCGVNGIGVIVLNRLRGLLVEQLRTPREEQLQVVVQLRHRPHRGARTPHGVGLVDGNRGRYTVYTVDGRLIHPIQKLAGIGREGLNIAALTLSKQGVKNQTGLTRTAGPRDHGEFVGPYIQVNVLQGVLTRTTNTDQSLT